MPDNPFESPLTDVEPERNNIAEITPTVMYRAYLLHLGSYRRRLAGRVIVVAASLGLIGLGLSMRNETFLRLFLIGIGTVLIFRVFLGSRTVLRAYEKQFRQAGKDRDVVRYEPNAQHLRTVTDDSDHRMNWSGYRYWKEDDGLILVYHHDSLYQVIPVDQLDDAIHQEIRQNLSKHCSRKM